MGQGWEGANRHVNLFSEEEREAQKVLGHNADHEREKREAELAAQRRSGLAPMPFGGGLAELTSHAHRWNPPSGPASATSTGSDAAARAIRLGKEVFGKEAKEVLKKDERRKGRLDPMSSLLMSKSTPDKTDNDTDGEQAGGSSAMNPLGCSARTDGDGDSGEELSGSDRKSRRKRRKQEKKHKKSKKKESKKPRRLRGRSRADERRSLDPEEDTSDKSEGTRQQALVSLEHMRSLNVRSRTRVS